MTNLSKKIMVAACKNRLAEGMAWDQIHTLYSKLTDDELAEIKNAINGEGQNENTNINI